MAFFLKNILSTFFYMYQLFDSCQNQISMDDLMDANVLLNHFFFQFKRLYGIEKMSYKLHAHIHLITQDYRYGRFNNISCFPFEGNFYIWHYKLYELITVF